MKYRTIVADPLFARRQRLGWDEALEHVDLGGAA